MKQFYDLPHKDRHNKLTSLLWINNYYKAAFTISRTPRTGIAEYYWYTMDKLTYQKVERTYCVYNADIIVDFDNMEYRVHELSVNMYSVVDQALLQLESLEDRPNYRNFIGYPLPKK